MVAPAARARLKNAAIVGQRDFELADRDVALGEDGGADIVGADQRIGAGHDDNGVVGIGDGDDAPFRCAPRPYP